jgi:hypothetical protein
MSTALPSKLTVLYGHGEEIISDSLATAQLKIKEPL